MPRPFLSVNDLVDIPDATKDQPDIVVPQAAIANPPTEEWIPATEYDPAKAPDLVEAWKRYTDRLMAKEDPRAIFNGEPITLPSSKKTQPCLSKKSKLILKLLTRGDRPLTEGYLPPVEDPPSSQTSDLNKAPSTLAALHREFYAKYGRDMRVADLRIGTTYSDIDFPTVYLENLNCYTDSCLTELVEIPEALQSAPLKITEKQPATIHDALKVWAESISFPDADRERSSSPYPFNDPFYQSESAPVIVSSDVTFSPSLTKDPTMKPFMPDIAQIRDAFNEASVTSQPEPGQNVTIEYPVIGGDPEMALPAREEIEPIKQTSAGTVEVRQLVEKPKPTPAASGAKMALLRQLSTYLTPGRAMFLGGGNIANRFQRVLQSFVDQAKAGRLESQQSDKFVLAILSFHTAYRTREAAVENMGRLVKNQLTRAWPRDNPKKFVPIIDVLTTVYLANIPLWDELLLNQESKPNETPTIQALPKQTDLATDCQPGEASDSAGDTVAAIESDAPTA